LRDYQVGGRGEEKRGEVLVEDRWSELTTLVVIKGSMPQAAECKGDPKKVEPGLAEKLEMAWQDMGVDAHRDDTGGFKWASKIERYTEAAEDADLRAREYLSDAEVAKLIILAR
jgi:hypothetical protein